MDSAFLAVARDTETGGGVLAAALAFRVFLFVIPYTFLIVALFDVAGSLASEDPRKVAKSAGIGGLLAQAVAASATHLTGISRFIALLAGLVAVLWAAWVFLRTLRVVHGLVWRVRVRKPTRPARAVGVLIVLFTICLLVSVTIEHLRNVSGPGGLGAVLGFTALPMAIWLAVEFALPHSPEAGWKDLVPGAILFGIAVLALHLFTLYWVANLIKRRSAIYGTIGVALAILLWAYVLGRIMTASAVLNATLWARAHPRAAVQESGAEPATAMGEKPPLAETEHAVGSDHVVDQQAKPAAGT